MTRRRTGLIKAAMSALHYSGASGLMSPLTRGVGVIFMLHRVRPAHHEGFSPNRILEVRPEFLDETISLVVDKGFDVISLDEAETRLAEGDFDKPFACFTFDDGYRDNREHAYPIFRRHGLPFTIYVPTDFPDGQGDLWWLKLEKAIGAIETLNIKLDGTWSKLTLGSVEEKDQAYEQLYWWLRSMPEMEARRVVGEMCAAHDVDTSGLCRSLIMDWEELRDLASDELVTIGAHTRRHLSLAKLTLAEAAAEIEESVRRLERELKRPVRHFSFPYGDETAAGPREFRLAKELGLGTAVTTRKGLIHERHAHELTALPRVSLNGDYQSSHYVKVMLSGAPFAFWNAAQRLPVGGGIAARTWAGFRLHPSGHTSSG
jgi:peptidoglycan/xylan/chitin deacetylase (PgdA/CDA1 family)